MIGEGHARSRKGKDLLIDDPALMHHELAVRNMPEEVKVLDAIKNQQGDRRKQEDEDCGISRRPVSKCFPRLPRHVKVNPTCPQSQEQENREGYTHIA